jgi:hypothetical protein
MNWEEVIEFKDFPFDSAIAQTTQPRIEQLQPPPAWDIPSSVSWGTIFTVLCSSAGLLAWKIYDLHVKPRQYVWLTRLKRPQENLEAISNGLQTVRGETGADRAVLMEVDSKRGTMLAVAQEVIHNGIAKITFSAKDNQADCVKKILQRFNDDSFINRETEQISDANQYQGFLNNYGVAYVIYYKIGEQNSTAWILALHFNYTAHVDYLSAIDLRQRIKQVCSTMYYLLLQRSPVEGLIK